MNLREEVPVNIVKWARLEKTMNDLFNTFEAWEQRNAELVNRFFDQPYFRWGESLIDKLIEVQDDIKFNDIKDEWINLAVLLYEQSAWEFKEILDSFSHNSLKRQFIEKIHEKLNIIIWTVPPYAADFYRCDTATWGTNVLWYFQHVVKYLEEKERAGGWAKKVLELLKDINITNEDLNWWVTIWTIPLASELKDATLPANTKKAFDKLLSFEIWKEVDRTINISRDIWKKIQRLLTNSFPAVNTIVGEVDEYKYDENKLWDEYKWKAKVIRDNTSLTDVEKEKQLNELKREYYLKYLKTRNPKIGNALEQLYNNNFDYSKLDRTVLKDYLDKVADIRLRMLFDSWLNDAIKLDFWNVNEFKHFYKELADVDPSNPILNLSLSNVNKATIPATTWIINIPVKKKLVGWENWRLKDINQFWKDAGKSFDALPIEYEINKADIESQPLTMEDKTKLLNLLSQFDQWDKYVIKWESVWVLIYLFFVINSLISIDTIDLDKQRDVENIFWKAKNHANTPGATPETKEWYTPEKFKKDMEKRWPWKFENWSEIWLPMWSSQLPGWWYQWMKIKLSNIDMTKWTFTGTVHWWELKFSSKLEWKSREFKMNEETFEEIKKMSKDSNKIWLQPDPSKSDFNTFRNSLNNKLWTSDFTFPPKWTTWDGKKFMQKIVDEDWKEKEVEVKYFWATTDDKSTYKVEYNPFSGSFTVSSSFNWDEKDKNWKSKKKRFSYKRDMDWNNFLIFFTQKWLVPQTEDESKDALARQDQEFKMVNGAHWTLNWFSFNNIKNWFKDIIWTIKKKIDEYDKEQTSKFKSMVESPLLDTISKLPLPASMKYAIWERQQEIYNERDNAVWKKIEYYLKIFQADPDFWTTFENLPPHIKTQWWKSLQQIVTDRVDHATDRMWDPWIYQAAALLLANIEKWWSPYRGLSSKENSGLWVKALLGKAHYEQFMRDKQKCINDLKNAWKEKDQIQDVLATCEMDYIINNVSWANWKLKYFGSHEDRWIPGKEGTNYIDNPSKRLLSNQFADKLKWAYKWRFNKKSVEDAFDKISHNDFNLAKEDFKRLIKSSRFPGALWNLKKMFLLAKNDEQKSEYQKCFLIYMLSGVLDFYGKKDLRKQAYQWAKTMSFLPWMLAKNTWHSEQVVALLDDWSGWDFSNNVKSFFHESDLKNWEVKIWKLIEELDWRWDVDKMNSFEKYSKSEFPTKPFPKNSILGKLQESVLDTWMENMDNSLLDNPLVANSGWLLSNSNVVHDRMSIRDGEFDWKDPDERNNRKEFWMNIAKEVNRMSAGNLQDVKLLLRQYCSWFGLSDGEEIYKWIKTAYYRKNYIWREITYKDSNRNEDSMWVIGSKEINSIIWYNFKWRVMSWRFRGNRLPPEMHDALNAFQNKFKEAFENDNLNNDEIIKDIFNVGNKNNIGVLWLWSWSCYNTNVTGRENSDSDDDTKAKNRIKRNFTSWNFINYYIANMEKSFRNLPSGDYIPVTTGTLDNLLDRFNVA